MSDPYLSVVIPIYNEADNLETLFSRLTNVLDNIGRSYEIVLTNDGSQDRSEEILQSIYQRRPKNIRVIHFNGNFGQHMAIMAAFEKARGEVIITLDADLQNPPEEIPKLLEKIDAGHDVVGSIRQLRRDSWFRRIASVINNSIRYRITKIRMTDQGCMFRAYRKHIVKLMVASRETSTFIPALACSYATNPTEVEVAHDAREAGKSKYRLYDLLRLNFDLMTGFSLVPLQVFTLAGIMVSIFSLLFVFYLFVRRIIVGPEADGLFTLFAILFFLIGIVLLGLGITGEYIGRIYQEVRKRPRYVIREILEHSDESAQS